MWFTLNNHLLYGRNAFLMEYTYEYNNLIKIPLRLTTITENFYNEHKNFIILKNIGKKTKTRSRVLFFSSSRRTT